ncbi:hypothetical protein Pmani_027639 [Petrolisthes manimaculis]|uniref:Proteasome subunit beta n=1 Tax=Petrolisthes manimaculis TaxID=1843537 RepID=A0AAE1P2K5_9EUCA|nr:hypothetical protein Pmani_027639 [Petrolisthes manimaculis]
MDVCRMFGEGAPPLWSGGPTPGGLYSFPGTNNKQHEAKTHTMYPSTSGTSVVGLVYDGGVMVGADTLGSYGSLARFRNVERTFKVTDKAVLTCSGDIADYQFIREVIEQKVRDDEICGFTPVLNAGALHCWLTRVLYNRRSRFDPLWLECVVAGLKDDKPFLGYVDKIGTAFEAQEVATGFGMHMAIPMIREAREKKGKLSRDDARKLLVDCLKVLYYRDCRAHFKYQVADVTAEGVKFENDLDLKPETSWSIANFVRGYE